MGFSGQEYWSGLPFPSTGHLLNPGIKPGSPTLQADFLLSEPPGKAFTELKPQQMEDESTWWSILYSRKKVTVKLITNWEVYSSLAKTGKGGTLHPPSDVCVRSFLCPFFTLIKLCFTKALEWSSLVPGPRAKSSSEITNPTSFTTGYQHQAHNSSS